MKPLSARYRTALVTGASAGLGRAFTEMLLAEGLSVWGTARRSDRLAELAGHPNFHPVVLDLGTPGAASAAFESVQAEADGIDILINNAGFGCFAPFITEEFATWEHQVQVMLVEPMRLAQQALRQFGVRGTGTLVNVASLAVEFPLPYMSGYNVVKAGLAAFSESLLVETAGSGVTVIDFRPGDYRTDFNRVMCQNSSHAAMLQQSAPLRRIWRTLEAHLQAAPTGDRAAADLRRALQRGRSGVVRSGSFFQARLAPAVMSLLPQSLQRTIRWRYFNVT